MTIFCLLLRLTRRNIKKAQPDSLQIASKIQFTETSTVTNGILKIKEEKVISVTLVKSYLRGGAAKQDHFSFQWAEILKNSMRMFRCFTFLLSIYRLAGWLLVQRLFLSSTSFTSFSFTHSAWQLFFSFSFFIFLLSVQLHCLFIIQFSFNSDAKRSSSTQ